MQVTVENVCIALPPSKVPRSVGVHVSSIIRGISQDTGILKPEWCEEFTLLEVKPSTRFLDPIVALRVSIGLAWEAWFIEEILVPQGVINHPGEWLVDNIYMSPDGESLDSIIVDARQKNRIVIHEVKLTYKSVRTVEDLQSQFMWLAQCKAYCRGANTRFAKLHVLFVCGDYSYPISPQLKSFTIEFTQKEIDETWELLVNYKNCRLALEREEELDVNNAKDAS